MLLSQTASLKIVNFMQKNKIISNDEKNCYLYCYEFVLDLILYNGSIFILGSIIGNPILAILYILTMTPTKMLAGGAHATSREKCSIISYTISILILLISQFPIYIEHSILFIVFLLCITIIIIFSPVETPNKSFSLPQKKKLKKYCIYYSLFLILLYLLLLYKKQGEYILLMNLCAIMIAVNQYIGILINKNDGRKKYAKSQHCGL